MPISRVKRICLAITVLCAVLVASPKFAALLRAESQQQSRITSVSITGSEPAGTFGGVAYRRVWGHVFGLVAPRDTIFGFDQLPHGADGNYGYESEFEIIAPENSSHAGVCQSVASVPATTTMPITTAP